MNHKAMTEGAPWRLILRFVLPVLAGALLQQLYNTVDAIVVGNFSGEAALSAVGTTGSLTFMFLAVAMGLSAGNGVIVAQFYGAGEQKQVRNNAAAGILFLMLLGVGASLLGILVARPAFVYIVNVQESYMELTLIYFRIYAIGLVFQFGYNIFASVLRAVGDSAATLYFLLITSILNIVLDLAFTVGMRKGVAGAAWATVISQGAAALLTFLYIYMKIPLLRPLKTDWYLNKGESRKQMQVGVPMALQFAITASGTMIMQTSINLFGSTAISAFTAASKVQNLFTQGIVSMGVSMTTYAGQNYGAQKIRRIREGVFKAMLILAAYSVAAAAAEILFLPQFSRLFFAGDVDMAAMLKWEYPYIYVSVAFFIPLCMIFINRNTMQGCGYSLLPMLCGVVELAARFIMAYISMAKHSYALAVAGDAAAWVAAGIFSMFSFFHVIRRIEKKLGEPVRNKEAEIDRHGV